jgi:hypothetical protein
VQGCSFAAEVTNGKALASHTEKRYAQVYQQILWITCTENRGRTVMKAGHEFEYQGIPYRVAAVGESRWTNSGAAIIVFAVNTTTGLGGRHFDLRADGQPYRFSPD